MSAERNISFFSKLTISVMLLLCVGATIYFGQYLMALINEFHKSSQNVWEKILSFTGDDEFDLYVYGSVIFIVVPYWSVSLTLLLIDVFRKPSSLAQYKVIREANKSLGRKQIIKVVKQVLFNQTFVGIPFATFNFFWLSVLIHPRPNVRELPSLGRAVFDILTCLTVAEVFSYYIHRFLLHHRRFYKYVHKKHHEWTAPIAIAAAYSHPIEYLLGGLIPTFAGLVVAGSHITVVWGWIAAAASFTCNDHSGYHFPFTPSQELHYFHHQQFNSCFGLFGVLDYFHGTDKQFRESIAFKRHTVAFHTEPLSKKYPNDKNIIAIASNNLDN